jgi:hypothetical protein
VSVHDEGDFEDGHRVATSTEESIIKVERWSAKCTEVGVCTALLEMCELPLREAERNS